MGRAARRRRVATAVAGSLAFVALAGLVTVLATHREAAAPNPDSAVIATVPPLATRAGGPATVAALPSTGDPDADPLGPLPDPWGGVDGSTPAWPAAPADPSAAVDRAVAEAADQGVRLSVVVTDRSTGQTLVRRDADVAYPSLSLLKVMIAADVLTNGWPAPAATSTATSTAASTATSTAASTATSTATSTAASTAASTDAVPDGTGDDPVDDTGGDPLPAVTDAAQVAALLTRMIATSDDVLAGDLYDAAGGDDLVDRVARRYGMTGTTPTPDGTYWGNVQVTADDLAALLTGVLADPRTAAVIGPAMRATTPIAADGVDQRFGMRLVPGAGSKQGWGCCLSGEAGIHSMGFTDDRIVVVLSGAEPDDEDLGNQDGQALQADPAARASFAAVDAAVRAALGGPAG